MILHLSLDEKVIDRCIESFEQVFPGQNRYIVLVKTENGPRYVKSDKPIFTEYGTRDFWEAVGAISQYDSIILHTLNLNFAKFIKKVKHKKVYWIEWGADLFVKLLEPRGYKLFYEEDTDWRFSHIRVPKIIYRCIKNIYSKYYINQVIPALKRIRYFVPDSMPDEYSLLLSYYPELKHLQYRNFFYYPIDEVVQANMMHCQELGKNIIVGNSSSVSGNHKEAFEFLSKINIGDSKVIVPLSYGNMKYADYVKETGYKLLGERFMPITDYLPLDEYNQLLSSAHVFIYPHYRQEAVGNILVSLYLGGKVFLNKVNPLLSFYKRLGLIIFDMDELTTETIKQPLQPEEVEHNREVLMRNYSKELQLKLIKDTFE